MQWFMTRYTSIPLGLQRLYIWLAQFIVENNCVECDGQIYLMHTYRLGRSALQ